MGFPFSEISEVIKSARTGCPHKNLKSSSGSNQVDRIDEVDPLKDLYDDYYNECWKCYNRALKYCYLPHSEYIIDRLVLGKNKRSDFLDPIEEIQEIYGLTENQIKRIKKEFYNNLVDEAVRKRLIPPPKKRK